MPIEISGKVSEERRRPVMIDFELVSSQGIERHVGLAVRLTAPFYYPLCAIIAHFHWLVANETIDLFLRS